MARSKRRGESAGGGDGALGPEAPALSFEAALEALEGVVARLEGGDMPLEAALAAFESGVALSRQCASTLDAAERRIEILMSERGGADARVAPFAHAGSDGRSDARAPAAPGAADEVGDPDDADDANDEEWNR